MTLRPAPHFRPVLLLCVGALGALFFCSPDNSPAATTLIEPDRPAADLIVTNAKVTTVDPEHPGCEAVAIIGERIVATGSRAEIEAWPGPATRVIDAGGRRGGPGFNDPPLPFVTRGGGFPQTAPKGAAPPGGGSPGGPPRGAQDPQ